MVDSAGMCQLAFTVRLSSVFSLLFSVFCFLTNQNPESLRCDLLNVGLADQIGFGCSRPE
jgi:hypothetical protein